MSEHHPLRLVDEELIHDQFDDLDPATGRLLASALQDGLRSWVGRLTNAWQRRDEQEVQRARHALRSLTGNFGAERLQFLADRGADHAGAADQIASTCEETIAAILGHSGWNPAADLQEG